MFVLLSKKKKKKKKKTRKTKAFHLFIIYFCRLNLIFSVCLHSRNVRFNLNTGKNSNSIVIIFFFQIT